MVTTGRQGQAKLCMRESVAWVASQAICAIVGYLRGPTMKIDDDDDDDENKTR